MTSPHLNSRGGGEKKFLCTKKSRLSKTIGEWKSLKKNEKRVMAVIYVSLFEMLITFQEITRKCIGLTVTVSRFSRQISKLFATCQPETRIIPVGRHLWHPKHLFSDCIK